MSKQSVFEHKVIVERQAAADALRRLADALESGTVTLSGGDRTVTVTAGATTALTVEVKQSPKATSLKVKCKWYTEAHTPLSTGSLRIEPGVH